MISASRLFDRDLVRGIISQEGLDPVPSGGSRVVARDGITITIEQYAWGRVFYGEWKARDVGCTWVERADEDPPPYLPPWVERVRAFVDRPKCLGYHEPDFVCDGGPNPHTGEREAACRWRTVCRYVQRVSKEPENIPRALEATDDELFARAAMMFPTPRRFEPREAPAIRVVATLDSGRALVESIAREVCRLGGWVFNEQRWRATVGQFYLVEHDRIASDRAPIFVLFRRRPRSWTGELVRDATTEQSIARFLLHARRDGVCTVQIRTGAVGLVRERLKEASSTLSADLVRENIGATTGGSPRSLATIRSVTAPDAGVVALAIHDVIQGGFLDSWGMASTDPDRKGAYREIGRRRKT